LKTLFESPKLDVDLFGIPQTRKRLPRRASVIAVKMTTAIAEKIRDIYKITPLNQKEIAMLFGIDQSRVSKIINNIWFPRPTHH
jgi:predicted XRE-type DNA-binding protein